METSAQSYFWTIFWACISGLAVLVGLVMELLAEKKWFKTIGSFRRWGVTKTCGELLVIFGIVGEIVVGGFAAKHEMETWLTANSNAALNQPASHISAKVRIQVAGEMFPTNIVSDASELATLLLCDESIVASKYQSLVANSFQPVHADNAREYWMRFSPFIITEIARVGSGTRGSKLKVADMVSGIKFVTISTSLFPTNSEIVGGFAEVMINDTPMLFRVLPQTNTIITRFKRPDVAILIATNCALENIGQKPSQ